MALTLKDILATEDLPQQQVDCPEWGGTVTVRSMRADERADLEKQFFGKGKTFADRPLEFRMALLRSCLIDEHGAPLLPDNDAARQFMSKSARVVERIIDTACSVNGWREQDVAELEKN